VGKDERIREAHVRAVKSALQEFKAFAATRIRGAGAEADRITGISSRHCLHTIHRARSIPIRLVFATHEVLVRGHSLRRIETALQRMEVSLLTTVSGNQRLLVPECQPVIMEISVCEAKIDGNSSEVSNPCERIA
jgi:hypothetical protein